MNKLTLAILLCWFYQVSVSQIVQRDNSKDYGLVGNVLEVQYVNLDSENNVGYISKVTFDENGYIQKQWVGYGILSESEEFFRNEKHKIDSAELSFEGQNHIDIYTYNEAGLLISKSTSGVTYKYKYDDSERLIYEVAVDANDFDERVFSETTYTHSKSDTVKGYTEGMMGEMIDSYYVNENLIQTINSNADEKRTFYYNSEGLLVKEVFEDDSSPYSVSYEYTFDSRGNWILQKAMHTEVDGSQYIELVQRRITYSDLEEFAPEGMQFVK